MVQPISRREVTLAESPIYRLPNSNTTEKGHAGGRGKALLSSSPLSLFAFAVQVQQRIRLTAPPHLLRARRSNLTNDPGGAGEISLRSGDASQRPSSAQTSLDLARVRETQRLTGSLTHIYRL